MIEIWFSEIFKDQEKVDVQHLRRLVLVFGHEKQRPICFFAQIAKIQIPKNPKMERPLKKSFLF